jgi:hypothetical protein
MGSTILPFVRVNMAITADGKSLAGFATDIRATAIAGTVQSIPAEEETTIPLPPEPQENWRDSYKDRLDFEQKQYKDKVMTGEVFAV